MFQLIHLHFTAARASEQAFDSVRNRLRGLIENRLARPEAVYSDRVTEILSQNHFRRRPWSPELLEEMDLESSLEVYRDRFADASDFTFVLVGNFELDGLRPLVQRYIGGLPSIGREESWRDVGVHYPEGVIQETVRRGLEPKSRVSIIFTGPFEWSRRNRYEINSMVGVLRTRLRELLREDEGGTYGVGVSATPRRFPRQEYSATVRFGCDPDRVEELIAAVYDTIRELQENGPELSYVEKIQEQHRRQRELQLRENGFWLAALELAFWHGEDPRLILDYDELVASLTPEAVQAAARRYFDFDRRVEVVLKPEQ
jgi:zinc protease